MKAMNKTITHLLLFCFFVSHVYAMEETKTNQQTEIKARKLLYSLQGCEEKEAFETNEFLPILLKNLFTQKYYTNQSGEQIEAGKILSNIFINSIEGCTTEKQTPSQHYKCVHTKINKELESLKSSDTGSATREVFGPIIDGYGESYHSYKKTVYLYHEIETELISALHISITSFDDWEKVWPILLKTARVEAKINLNYSDYHNNRTRCAILTEALRQPKCIDGKKRISTRKLLMNKLNTILQKCNTEECLTKMLKEAHGEAKKSFKEYSEYGFACHRIYGDYTSALETIGFEPGNYLKKNIEMI